MDEINKSFSAEDMLKQAEDELAATGGTETGPEEEGRPDASDADFTEDKEHPDRNWYVIHTYSGYENKVKTNLERRIKSMEKEDKIFRVLIPTEEDTSLRMARKKLLRRRYSPDMFWLKWLWKMTPGIW